MEKNKPWPKFSIAVLLSTLLFSQLHSQLLDKPLEKYRTQIVSFLRLVHEIPADEADSNYDGKIYSRLLGPKSGKHFFQTGTTSPHSRKYIIVISADNMKIFNTSNLLNDLPDILRELKTVTKKLSSMDVILFLQEVNAIYSYNTSPPWHKK